MNLLAFVPFPYRVFAVAVLALALLGYGYVEGLHHGEAELTAYRGAVEIAAAEQQQANARAVIHQKEVTDHVTQDYEQRLAGLRARFGGVQYADTGAVPAVAVSTPSTDGAGAESAIACPTGFVENAAEDALKVQAFQAWVLQQGIAIER